LDTAAPHTGPHSSQSHLPEKTRQEPPLKISPYTSHQFRVRHPYTDSVVEEYPMAGDEDVHLEVLEEEGDVVSGESILPERSLLSPYINQIRTLFLGKVFSPYIHYDNKSINYI